MDHENFRLFTSAMRAADELFQGAGGGGGTRHYIRDCLIPEMEKRRLVLYRHDDVEESIDPYDLGRHDERERTMQLIGGVRMDAQTGGTGDALDKLVMCIASEPLVSKPLSGEQGRTTTPKIGQASQPESTG